MIKLIETFDNISTGQSFNLLDYYGSPYTVGSDVTLLEELGWIVVRGNLPHIDAGVGRMGTAAYGCTYGAALATPSIGRKGTRLIMGVSVMLPVSNAGWGGNAANTIGLEVYFRYGEHVNFRITCRYNPATNSVTVSMMTGATGVGYPAITIAEPVIPTPYATQDYTFFEFSVDVTDYHNGRARVAVNGKTYVDKSGIVTAAYNVFGDNPYDDRATLDNVYFGPLPKETAYSVTWAESGYHFDTIYLCDDSGGYQDDFLGPIFSKTFYPVAAGSKSNWIPYVNSMQFEDGMHFARVDDDPVVPGNELEYLEADQDLADESFVFPLDAVPPGSALISVNHRTMFRNVASQGTPPPHTLVPLYQIAGNPAVITNSLAKKLTGWSYGFMDVYYNTVPGLAIPWTEFLLEQSEFGFLMREETWMGLGAEELAFADEVIDE